MFRVRLLPVARAARAARAKKVAWLLKDGNMVGNICEIGALLFFGRLQSILLVIIAFPFVSHPRRESTNEDFGISFATYMHVDVCSAPPPEPPHNVCLSLRLFFDIFVPCFLMK